MRIASGTRIGPYEVESLLGAGGMGEVYLARDLRLHRPVALKFVGAAGDAERLHREARAAAALDHPFICKIYDVGETDGATYIAMEYVAGRTLAARLAEGPIPLAEAVGYAIEITDALQIAHRRGVVHRDLKPSNIMLAEDGHVKIVDFGLAAKPQSQPGETTGLATHHTSTRGTLAYMAPEQLRGEPADLRSDLFAFGIVLTQLVTGRHPFGEASGIELASAILQSDPRPWPPGRAMPPLLPNIAGKLLKKARADRYQSTGDVLTDLRQVAAELSGGSSRVAPGDVTVSLSPPRRVPLIVWIAAGLALAALVAWVLRGAYPGRAVPASAIQVTQVTSDGTLVTNALSPDGRSVAYLTEGDGTRRLLVRDIGGGAALELVKDPWLDNLAWFPDGLRIHYTNNRGGWAISRLGGAPSPSFPTRPFVFSPDGTQIAATSVREPVFFLADLDGRRIGDDVIVAGAKALYDLDWHRKTNRLLLRGIDLEGRHAVWTATPDGKDVRKIHVDSGQLLSARWSPALDVIYVLRASSATGFDLVALDLDRNPLTPRVLASGLPLSNDLTISSDGHRLLQIRGIVGMNLVSIDVQHPGDPPRAVTHGTGLFRAPTISPDGQWVAAVSGVAPPTSIVKIPVGGGEPVVLAAGEGRQFTPAWSPDGQRVAYGSDRNGSRSLWIVDADGRNQRRLDVTNIGPAYSVGWTPDGHVVWQQTLPDNRYNFRIRDLATGREELAGNEQDGLSIYTLPIFSPAGDQFVTRGSRPPRPAGTWLLSWPGRVPHQVTEHLNPLGWSADGQSIYEFLPPGSPGGTGFPVPLGIWQVSVATGQSRLIATLPSGVINDGVMTPDHAHIILSVTERHGDAWLAERFDPRVGG